MDELQIDINRSSATPAYRQLYQQIAERIKKGDIPAGSYLPKIRSLATDLGIARNTVENAYRQLALEGYTSGFRGRGYIVEQMDLSQLATSGSRASSSKASDLSPAHPGRNPLGDDLGCKYDFSYGNRAPEDFPMHLWRTHADRVMTSAYGKLATSYMEPFGLPSLRQELAKYLGETRNVSCRPEQVVLLPGTQTSLQRICALFPESNRIIAMEDPGYDAARKVFLSSGWNIAPVPTSKTAQAFVSSVIKSDAHVLFCTPSNQFPLGYTLPIATRLELIGWAKRTGSYIIEDDYCCEFRYDGSSPIPSLQSLDADHVIYMGTVSKILTPAIRMSYIVLPQSLIPVWERENGHFFCAVDWISQAVLQSLMTSGDWQRHVRSTVTAFHQKHAMLVDAIERELGERVQLVGESAGLHLLVGDGNGRRQNELIRLALTEGVRVYETNPYWMQRSHPMDNYVLMGFSAIDANLIEAGIQALAKAWYK